MNQQIKTVLGIAIIVIIAIAASAFLWTGYNQESVADYDTGQQVNQPKSIVPDDPMKACTEEAKICPDGVTAVGRTGPDCEFAPCPRGNGGAEANIEGW